MVEALDVLQKNDIVDLITTFDDQHRFGLKKIYTPRI
jgi:hypothetical protein